MASPLSISFALPFADAITAARARNVVLPDVYYGAVADSARRAAFTISHLAGLSQIRDVLDSLTRAQEDGVGFAQWQSSVTAEATALTRPRLNLVFRNYAQTAYSAGHWRAFSEQSAARPLLMYSAINDSRTRPAHAAMSGYIAPIDDPVWKTWTPPCGHNCRCSQISLTPDQALARGYVVGEAPPPVAPDAGFGGHPLEVETAAAGLLYQEAAAIDPSVVQVVAGILGRVPSGIGALVRDVLDALLQRHRDGN